MSNEGKSKVNLESQDISQGMQNIHNSIDNFVNSAGVEAVYGKPIKSGDVTIIPTAEVFCGMGFGLGMGMGTFKPDADEGTENPEVEGVQEGDPPSEGAGMGGGGGGYTFSRPVALVISSPDGVRVEPILDRTKLIIATLTTVGFMMGMMGRMMRGGR